MSVDPFNAGAGYTLDSVAEPDRQRRAALAVMHKFRGTGDMWSVLSVLGLTDTAEDMLTRRALRLTHAEPLPETSPVPLGPLHVADPTPDLTRWCGSGEHLLPAGECKPCRNRRSRDNRAAKRLRGDQSPLEARGGRL